MPANKRTAFQREKDLQTLSQLYLQGEPLAVIAKAMGVTPPQISYDLKKLKQRWRESSDWDMNEELRRLELVEAEAWRAWRASKQAGSPDRGYLETVRSSIATRAKLLGIGQERVNVDVRVIEQRLVPVLELFRVVAGEGELEGLFSSLAAGDGAATLRRALPASGSEL